VTLSYNFYLNPRPSSLSLILLRLKLYYNVGIQFEQPFALNQKLCLV